jgi:hypothetical protein
MSLLQYSNASCSTQDFLQAATQDEYDPRVLVYSALIASFPFLSFPFLSFPALVSCFRTTPTAYRHNAATTQQPYVPSSSHFMYVLTPRLPHHRDFRGRRY